MSKVSARDAELVSVELLDLTYVSLKYPVRKHAVGTRLEGWRVVRESDLGKWGSKELND